MGTHWVTVTAGHARVLSLSHTLKQLIFLTFVYALKIKPSYESSLFKNYFLQAGINFVV